MVDTYFQISFDVFIICIDQKFNKNISWLEVTIIFTDWIVSRSFKIIKISNWFIMWNIFFSTFLTMLLQIKKHILLTEMSICEERIIFRIWLKRTCICCNNGIFWHQKLLFDMIEMLAVIISATKKFSQFLANFLTLF